MRHTQPDGSVVTVLIEGDENSHSYFSIDNYPLLFDGNGALRYALPAKSGHGVVPSEFIAADPTVRSSEARELLGKVDACAVARLMAADNRLLPRRTPSAVSGLFSYASFPTRGKQKALIILVEYQDVSFSLDNPQEYFSNILNKTGCNDLGATGSARDWFIEASDSLFVPDFDVYGPVQLQHERSYYGENGLNGNDQNPHKMAIEACQQLDNDVDFRDYDRDGDGIIDNVFIYYAGVGENSAVMPSAVWPHAWNVTTAESTPYMFDGVKLDRYACSSELIGGRVDGIGTFIHEFSHVMGLPDLYSTVSGTGAFTPGKWSVMDAGPYNNNSHTPPTYSSFERYALGWLEPRELTEAATVKLENLSTNQACIVRVPNANEYYLFENRQQNGWDRYLPGHGMIVWHVDYKADVWNANKVNNDATHQYVDLVEADGIQSDATRTGDSFPGTSGVTAFTDDTTPSMRSWFGEPLFMPITDITESESGLITFKADGGGNLPEPVEILSAEAVSPLAVRLAWTPSAGAVNYRIWTSGNGDETYCDAGPVTEFTVDGLQPATEYSFAVSAENENGFGELSARVGIATMPPTFDLLAPESNEPSGVTSSSFVASWEPMDAATEYFLKVYSYVSGDPLEDSVTFDGGIDALPAGWSTTSRLTFANTAYSGQAVPALRLAADEASVNTPVYTDRIHSLTFWHRGSSATADDRLVVEALVGDTWETVEELAVNNSAGGEITVVDNLPEQARSVAIRYHRPNAKGSVAIDDIIVKWGGEAIEVPHAVYNGISVGLATSIEVGGLEASTEYYYIVSATDGTLHSKWSDAVAVTTLDSDNSIAIPAAGTVDFRISGRRIATDTEMMAVFDAMGCCIGYGRELELPRGGVYIVRIGTRIEKIVIY